jgi:glutathione-specific gamma-glutamylcyclotransferase
MDLEGEHWIFGYGSLMWRPDFIFAERVKARLAGYHRSLCIYSHHYRGTPEKPGLVLGLDRGGSCVGIAFRIEPELWPKVLDAVRKRELVSGVYVETSVRLLLADGRQPRAVTYLADRAHSQYAGKLTRPAMLDRVRHCSGAAGPNVDYVRNTHQHLLAIGISDANLGWIVEAIGEAAHAS